MSEFLTKNWLWLTFVIIATPLITTVGVIWLRAWQLSLSVWMKGIHLGIVELMLMQMRKVDTILLVNQLLVAKQNQLVSTPKRWPLINWLVAISAWWLQRSYQPNAFRFH